MYAWIVHTNKEMPKKTCHLKNLSLKQKTTTMTINTIQWAQWAQWAQCLLSPFLTATVGSFPWLKQYKTHNHHPPSRWKHRVTGSTCSTRCCTQRVPVWKESLDIVGVVVTLLGRVFPNVFDLQKLISWNSQVFRLFSGCPHCTSKQPGGNMPKDNDNYQLAPPTSTPSLRCSISMPMISVSCSRIFMASHLYVSIGTDIICQTTDIICQNKHASGSHKFRNILHFGSSRFISFKTKLQLQLWTKLLVFITRACNVSCPSQPPKMYIEWP